MLRGRGRQPRQMRVVAKRPVAPSAVGARDKQMLRGTGGGSPRAHIPAAAISRAARVAAAKFLGLFLGRPRSDRALLPVTSGQATSGQRHHYAFFCPACPVYPS